MALILVNTTTDEADGSITDGDTSLRDAITLAAPGDTITFADGPGEAFEDGGTIQLDRALGQMVIETDLTINGDLDDDGTPDVTLDAQGNGGILNVVNGTSNLNGLTITGSQATPDFYGGFAGALSIQSGAHSNISNCRIVENIDGAIANAGTISINNTDILSNEVGYFGSFGGILNIGTAYIFSSNIEKNNQYYSLSSGSIGTGAILNEGEMHLEGVTVYRNRGSVSNYGDLSIVDSIITKNVSSERNAGISNSGNLSLINTTVSDNLTGYGGNGGISNGGNAILINATLSGNTVGFGAVGGFANFGTATFINSTVTGNSSEPTNYEGVGGISASPSATTTLINSIVLGNEGRVKEIDGDLTLQGGNIVGETIFDGETAVRFGVTAAEVFESTVDNNGVAAGELADNGGGVPTIALRNDPANPAIDAGTGALPADDFDLDGDGDTAEPLPVDARGPGFARDVDSPGAGATPDLGAFEVQESAEIGTTIEIEARGTPAAGLFPSLRVLLDNTLLDSVTVGATEQTYTFEFAGLDIEDASKLEIRFANDVVVRDPGTGAKLEDRNLFVTEVTINGEEVPINGNAAVIYERLAPNLNDIPGQTMLFWNGDLAVDLDAVFS